MIEQITLFDNDPLPWNTAEAIYSNYFENTLKQIVSSFWAPEELLSFRKTQAKGVENEDAVWYGNSCLMKIVIKKKKKYFLIPQEAANALPKDLTIESIRSEAGLKRVLWDSPKDFPCIKSAVQETLRTILNNYPVDFDCCSQYMDCSNHKQCVNANKLLSMGCSYKRKLQNGIIFFGPNRTVK